MNYISLGSSKLSGAALAAILSSLVLVGSAHAQNLYFDPNNTKSEAGGSGSFSTGSFYNGSGDQTFTSGDAAYFNGAAGDVSVETPISASDVEINVTSGTENIGTAGKSSQITMGPIGFNYSLTAFNINNGATGTENVNFNSNINLNVVNQYYNDLTATDNTSGNLAFNGGITFTNNTSAATDPSGNSMGEPNLEIYSGNGGTVTINSAVTLVNVNGSEPNGNGPYIGFDASSPSSAMILTGGASFTNVGLNVNSGTVLDQGATYSGTVAQVGGTGQYLTDADNVNVSTTIQNNGGNLTVGGALADNTSFSGVIVNYGGYGAIELTAAAGGTVTFSNSVEFNGNKNQMIDKIGAGTVNMTYSEGTIGGRTFGGNSEIENGTLLLNADNALSTQGTTLTIDEVLPKNVNAAQTEATLGGGGSFLGGVVAAGPHSVIEPGSPTSIAALSLDGGLVAQNGVTLVFKLNGGDELGYGVTNDYIYAGSLTLNGPVTVDFINLGTITTGTPYVLMSGGSEDWSGTPDFTFNVPAGYALDPGYGTPDPNNDGNDLGYNFSTAGTTFSVQFIAVPEPSTCAMWLGGLALLGFIVRRKGALIG
jgi:hypothetical protein